jgi:hypothetical protein
LHSYFAFENEIQNGYITEKLFETLRLPLVPVYYGSPHLPNITSKPSFIVANHFASPKLLAAYLLYLDANPKEYEAYHAWRSDPQPFAEEYLQALQHRVVGPVEINLHNRLLPKYQSQTKDMWWKNDAKRAAACCRLCDPDYVKWAKKNRNSMSYSLVPSPYSPKKLDRYYFGG